MTKQKIMKIKNKYDWITKIQYRISCDDLIIEQYKEGDKENRQIYISREEIDEFVKFFTKNYSFISQTLMKRGKK